MKTKPFVESILSLFALLLLSTIAYGPDAKAQSDLYRHSLGCSELTWSANTTGVVLESAFPNLSFQRPVALLQAPGDDSRWFVVEQNGRVMVFTNDPQVTQATVFIDIRDRVDADFSEAGLLSMAFHPNFAVNQQVYLSYTRSGTLEEDVALVSVLSRFLSADQGHTLDPASEIVMGSLRQPATNHQGGGIAFGPDGYLYIALGDGGPGNDPFNKGQNTYSPFGAILRVDLDSAFPYAVPPDNPLVEGGGIREIYAWGFRNPWRWSFDRATGELWVGDVGQNQWEEINLVQKGGNYGWRVREGAHCFQTGNCDTTGLIDPVVEYSHAEGCSVTGGYVYRGALMPFLQGTYIYGDFCSGRIWGLNHDTTGVVENRVLLDSFINISSFSEGHDGEIYVLNYSGGGIYRLASAAGAASCATR